MNTTNGGGQPEKDTFFAPAGRTSGEQLKTEIKNVCDNVLVTNCLNAFGGVVLVLNSCRQIVAVNSAFLRFIGIEEPESLLGLRPGEALKCVHVDEAPNGCGTGRACRDCGAAIAIVAAQSKHQATASECLLTTTVNGLEESFEFRVCASSVLLSNEYYTLVTLQDIRAEKKLEVMQRVFLHDVANLLTAIHSTFELLQRENSPDSHGYLEDVHTLITIMSDTVSVQRDLVNMEMDRFEVSASNVSIALFFEKLRQQFQHISEQTNIGIVFVGHEASTEIAVSEPLIHRVLENMILNAVEAAPANSQVCVSCEDEEGLFAFHVWNAGKIPDRVMPHIFTRYYTTKGGVGRGLGAYSMKLIGERYLKGKVTFTTSERDGTLFSLRIPKQN
jgi:K+-sensing histidine kinase KdpD